MAPFVVHTIPGSPFARAVLVALEEKRLPYRLAALTPGTLRSEEHLARHPFGRMPVIDHGDFRLYETQAILRYIDRVLPEPALTPAHPQGLARMDQLMNISDWYLFQGVGNVIAFHRIIRPRLMGLAGDENAISEAMPKARMVFDELARLLAEQPYFVGAALSLADVILAPQLDFLSMTPEWQPLTQKHENLRGWLARMNARPSMTATTWERVTALAKAA